MEVIAIPQTNVDDLPACNELAACGGAHGNAAGNFGSRVKSQATVAKKA